MIAFLRAKMAAFAARVTPATEGVAMQRSHEPILERVARGELPISALRDLESELDSVIRIALRKTGAQEIEAELQAKFGSGSLGPSADKVVHRVIKNRAIASLEEARLVRDFLSDGPAAGRLGTAKSRQLEGLLVAWERTAPKEQ